MRNGNGFARLDYGAGRSLTEPLRGSVSELLAHATGAVERIQAPAVIRNWYLKKFGVCERTEEMICGVPGLHLRLPVPKEQLKANLDLAEFFARQAAEIFAKEGVGIVLPPKEFPAELSGVRIADGVMMFAFLIMPAIRKALSLRGVDIKTAEILIIDGDPELTHCLIENIYPQVNYLSLATEERDYSQRAAEIFEDCGLNLCVTGKNPYVQESADLVINAGAEGVRHYFKRNAVYFELGRSGHKESFMELLRKRPDLLAADGLSVRVADQRVDLRELEAVFYSISGEYRRLLRRGFDRGLAAEVINRMDTVVFEGLRLTRLEKALS